MHAIVPRNPKHTAWRQTLRAVEPRRAALDGRAFRRGGGGGGGGGERGKGLELGAKCVEVVMDEGRSVVHTNAALAWVARGVSALSQQHEAGCT